MYLNPLGMYASAFTLPLSSPISISSRFSFSRPVSSCPLISPSRSHVARGFRVVKCVAAPGEHGETAEADMHYDDLVSDEDYVVIDGKDVGALIEQLRANGLDDIGDSASSVADSVLKAAERAEAVIDSDTQDPANSETSFGGLGSLAQEKERLLRKEGKLGGNGLGIEGAGLDEHLTNFGGVAGEGSMEYFTDENMSFMPSWARSAFLDGSYVELEKGASRIGIDRGARRLDEIVAADRARSRDDARVEGLNRTSGGLTGIRDDDENMHQLDVEDGGTQRSSDGMPSAGEDRVDEGDPDEDESVPFRPGSIEGDWAGAGIADCSVEDVAIDYNIPVELVIDVMSTYGVSLPISPKDGVRDRMTMEEIERLLELITSFDCMDLSERYSDHTLLELAEEYDVDSEALVAACEAEDIYLALGKETRLQLSREDRVVDIARGRAVPGGFEYPPLLHGLIVGDDAS